MQYLLKINNLIKILIIVFSFSLGYSQNQKLYKYEKKLTHPSYVAQEFSILNEIDNITLSGTLVYKNNNYKKIVIIVPGSGQDKRNSHYKLAENLIDSGVAIFRYDDRGVGESGGKFNSGISGFENDLSSVLKYFRNKEAGFDKKKIGVIGHSLGGHIALKSFQDGRIADFYVFLATPGEAKGTFFEYQSQIEPYVKRYKVKNESPGETFRLIQIINTIIADNSLLEVKKIRKKIKAYFKSEGIKRHNRMYTTGWYIDMAKQDFSTVLKAINQPALWVFAKYDSKIDSDREKLFLENIKNPKFNIQYFDDFNHYFFNGNRQLYDMDDEVLKTISSWISKQ